MPGCAFALTLILLSVLLPTVHERHDYSQTAKDLKRRRVDRALAALEEAVSRCREEDMRDGSGVLAALEFLALHAREQWPFEQFRKALADPSMDGSRKPAGKCSMRR